VDAIATIDGVVYLNLNKSQITTAAINPPSSRSHQSASFASAPGCFHCQQRPRYPRSAGSSKERC